MGNELFCDALERQRSCAAPPSMWIEVKPGDLDQRVGALLPGYMTMGQTGMGMGRMAEIMPLPPNSISMKSAVGPWGDYMTAGGMFTVVKIRDNLRSYKDPGWHKHPGDRL